jgi:hypothetical protein
LGSAIETGWPKDATDNFLVKLEAVCGDQKGTFKIHSAGDVLKENERVSVASSPYDGRRPKPRPDVNRGEDPDRVFIAADDRPNLVSPKLRDCESCYSSIVEPTTRMGGLFEPSSDSIPGDLLYPSDGRLVRALDAECGDFVEGRTPVLESMIGCAGVRAECLPATPAQISTTLSRVSLVAAVANDVSDTRQRAFPVRTFETLHYSSLLLTPVDFETDRLRSSLK